MRYLPRFGEHVARMGTIRVLMRVMFRPVPSVAYFLFTIFIVLYWVLASLFLPSVLSATFVATCLTYGLLCISILFSVTLNYSSKTVPTSKIMQCHIPEDHSLKPVSFPHTNCIVTINFSQDIFSFHNYLSCFI
jgi:hypothetical protein